MDFKKAYNLMLEGKRISRPCFKGYWYIDGVTGEFKIHLKDGDEITEGNLGHTVLNTLATDWDEASLIDEEIKKIFGTLD